MFMIRRNYECAHKLQMLDIRQVTLLTELIHCLIFIYSFFKYNSIKYYFNNWILHIKNWHLFALSNRAAVNVQCSILSIKIVWHTVCMQCGVSAHSRQVSINCCQCWCIDWFPLSIDCAISLTINGLDKETPLY